MTARRCAAVAGAAVAMTAAVALAGPGQAGPAKERPRGVVEDCSRISGVMATREFTKQRNLVIGPLAILRARGTLDYIAATGGIGNKLFVLVRGGHRVTLELSPETRRDAGLAFGPYPDGDVGFSDTRRVVTFVACRRGESTFTSEPDGWPISGWVGFLIARAPMCVPVNVWIDDERSPRRAVIRFGVRSC